MNAQSPAAKLEARANRENAKLMRAREELEMIVSVVKHSELPSDMKLRLYGALRNENDLISFEQERINGLRKAAEISRGKQWVTHSEDG